MIGGGLNTRCVIETRELKMKSFLFPVIVKKRFLFFISV